MSKTHKPAKPSRKTSPAVATPKPSTENSLDIKTTKTASCHNLSGHSGLTYEMGKGADGKIYIRIASNTGGGFFSPEWIAWEAAYAACSAVEPLTSMALKALFRGKSINSAGFLLAALAAEGLVRRKPQRLRHYELTAAAHKLAKKSAGKDTTVTESSPADSSATATTEGNTIPSA